MICLHTRDYFIRDGNARLPAVTGGTAQAFLLKIKNLLIDNPPYFII